ncbi:hypothetical protein CLI64_17695 [Nostoc sp. CENA543]|uniref:hypothetical protein n=1 Tax=Nostoc sp. CENA543 TaxID=1869241 RepID=UPI000CA21850|nr:hypothetical protein [Nostoc sp. CENA543]AUT02070.1 hypothetical protein CLI64_17695 [Nostoc sp. CENA543]
MSHRVNQSEVFTNQSRKYIKYVTALSCLTLGLTNAELASAHKVEIAADVGATLHIQPNDNPRAGETAQAWFALTRKGGKTIPLAQCNCQLAIYAEPHSPGEPALIEPSLKPVNAERYQGIPGADITFPKPGIYQLQLTGKPKSGANFQPFKFNFEVTVAAGVGVKKNPVSSQQTIDDVAIEKNLSSFPVWAIAIPTVTFLGIAFGVWQLQKGKGSAD